MNQIDFKISSIFDNFIKLFILNRTNNSIILKIKNIKTNEYFVLKMISSNIISKKIIENEFNIHNSLNHPYILPFIQKLEIDGFTCFQFPLLNNGTLTDIIQNKNILNQKALAILFFRILLGIKYIHSKKILHGDISPNNIMIENKDFNNLIPKIIDFGNSKKLCNDEECCCKFGTKGFAAPEIEKGKPHSFQVDIFSLGMIIKTILKNQIDLYNNNLNSLINNMTSIVPNYRPNVNQCLQNDYFVNILGIEFMMNEFNIC